MSGAAPTRPPRQRLGPRVYNPNPREGGGKKASGDLAPLSTRGGVRRFAARGGYQTLWHPIRLTAPARGQRPMIIDRETFTELAVHLKLASDAILKTARHLAVLSNGD